MPTHRSPHGFNHQPKFRPRRRSHPDQQLATSSQISAASDSSSSRRADDHATSPTRATSRSAHGRLVTGAARRAPTTTAELRNRIAGYTCQSLIIAVAGDHSRIQQPIGSAHSGPARRARPLTRSSNGFAGRAWAGSAAVAAGGSALHSSDPRGLAADRAPAGGGEA
jgi:hypothetical protein